MQYCLFSLHTSNPAHDIRRATNLCSPCRGPWTLKKSQQGKNNGLILSMLAIFNIHEKDVHFPCQKQTHNWKSNMLSRKHTFSQETYFSRSLPATLRGHYNCQKIQSCCQKGWKRQFGLSDWVLVSSCTMAQQLPTIQVHRISPGRLFLPLLLQVPLNFKPCKLHPPQMSFHPPGCTSVLAAVLHVHECQ